MQEGILKVSAIEYSENKEVTLITCSLQEGDLDFDEGQFLMLETVDFEFEGKKLKKPYSIASTHNQLLNENSISFSISRVSEYGMSNYLTRIIKPGDHLKFQGPLGDMIDTKEYNKYLFVSIGTGLVPLYSHYIHIIQEDPSFDKVVNIFGEKTEADLISSIKTNLEINTDKIKNSLLISRQEEVSAGLYKGHVQDKLDEALAFLGDTNFVAFLCGTPVMVIDIKQKLLDAGLKEEQIKFEMY